VPQSVTESSMFENEARRKDGKVSLAEEMRPAALNFNPSERYDDSMMSPDGIGAQLAPGQDPMELMGISLDSHSISMIDQSLTMSKKRIRKQKKQKQDLDGSKIYREVDVIEIDSPDRPKKAAPKVIAKKEVKKPIKNNFTGGKEGSSKLNLSRKLAINSLMGSAVDK